MLLRLDLRSKSFFNRSTIKYPIKSNSNGSIKVSSSSKVSLEPFLIVKNDHFLRFRSLPLVVLFESADACAAWLEKTLDKVSKLFRRNVEYLGSWDKLIYSGSICQSCITQVKPQDTLCRNILNKTLTQNKNSHAKNNPRYTFLYVLHRTLNNTLTRTFCCFHSYCCCYLYNLRTTLSFPPSNRTLNITLTITSDYSQSFCYCYNLETTLSLPTSNRMLIITLTRTLNYCKSRINLIPLISSYKSLRHRVMLARLHVRNSMDIELHPGPNNDRDSTGA